ncbi:MAG: hypothetical protein DRQ55_01445 [Planctomycetota bacterium]|nr:MAG: hypothetical protein DRQ55_01445 [Planctomycetota bacterium]
MLSVRPLSYVSLALLVSSLLGACASLGDAFVPPPTQTNHPVDFDELHTLAEHSQLAYQSEAEIEARFGASVQHGVLPLSDVRYHVTNEGGRQVVSIRGTSSLPNLAVDAVVDLERAEFIEIDMHEGFLRVGQQLGFVLLAELDADQPVVLTGHSMGGALAVVAGLYLDQAGYEVQAVTFGQPKVTTLDGALQLTNGGTGLRVDRVVYRGDPVADMPPYIPDDDVLLYAHVGPEILLWTDAIYSYLESRQILLDPDVMLITELPASLDTANHSVDGYVARLARLRQAAREVPYHERHDV